MKTLSDHKVFLVSSMCFLSQYKHKDIEEEKESLKEMVLKLKIDAEKWEGANGVYYDSIKESRSRYQRRKW